ncbi:MAG: hypothetical protein MJ202_00205 [Lentisphaeria bacterium]|nr:hypothetical protein [Lentisphaeria bacterium]
MHFFTASTLNAAFIQSFALEDSFFSFPSVFSAETVILPKDSDAFSDVFIAILPKSEIFCAETVIDLSRSRVFPVSMKESFLSMGAFLLFFVVAVLINVLFYYYGKDKLQYVDGRETLVIVALFVMLPVELILAGLLKITFLAMFR